MRQRPPPFLARHPWSSNAAGRLRRRRQAESAVHQVATRISRLYRLAAVRGRSHGVCFDRELVVLVAVQELLLDRGRAAACAAVRRRWQQLRGERSERVARGDIVAVFQGHGMQRLAGSRARDVDRQLLQRVLRRAVTTAPVRPSPPHGAAGARYALTGLVLTVPLGLVLGESRSSSQVPCFSLPPSWSGGSCVANLPRARATAQPRVPPRSRRRLDPGLSVECVAYRNPPRRRYSSTTMCSGRPITAAAARSKRARAQSRAVCERKRAELEARGARREQAQAHLAALRHAPPACTPPKPACRCPASCRAAPSPRAVHWSAPAAARARRGPRSPASPRSQAPRPRSPQPLPQPVTHSQSHHTPHTASPRRSLPPSLHLTQNPVPNHLPNHLPAPRPPSPAPTAAGSNARTCHQSRRL